MKDGTMPLIIRRITQHDLDIIYQDLENAGLLSAAKYLRSYWLKEEKISGMTLAIDEEHGAYLWPLPMSRDDSSFRYLFSMSGQKIVLEMLSTQLFCIQRTVNFGIQYLETAKIRFVRCCEWADS